MGHAIPIGRRIMIKNDILTFFALYPSKYFKMRRVKKWLDNELNCDYNQKEIVSILLEMHQKGEIECIPRHNYWLYKYKKGVTIN